MVYLQVSLFFMGLHSGLLSIVGAPDMKTVESLRGKQFAVDARASGFVYILDKLLRSKGSWLSLQVVVRRIEWTFTLNTWSLCLSLCFLGLRRSKSDANYYSLYICDPRRGWLGAIAQAFGSHGPLRYWILFCFG
jgi:hypothetical protein